jgi:hypothetical protein
MKQRQIKYLEKQFNIDSHLKGKINGNEFISYYFLGSRICSVYLIKKYLYQIVYNFQNNYINYAYNKNDITKTIKEDILFKKIYLLSREEVTKIKVDPYITIKEYTDIDKILKLIKDNDEKFDLDGYKINPSIRLKTFSEYGVICKHCGIEGKIFKLQKIKKDNCKTLHLNLYSDNGTMLTSDHINPISKSKDNSLQNRQPLCSICNENKGDKI